MLPAHERFDTHHVARAQRHLGLEMDDEAVVCERLLEGRQRHFEREIRRLRCGGVARGKQLREGRQADGLAQCPDDVETIRGGEAACGVEHPVVEAADQNHAGPAAPLREVPQQLDAVPARHPQVEHHHVESIVVDGIELGGIRGARHVVPRAAGDLRDELRQFRLVVHDEQTRRLTGLRHGRAIVCCAHYRHGT
jgi:hypothetical protein